MPAENGMAKADLPEFREVHAVISDMHMSAGSRARMDRGFSWYRKFWHWVARMAFGGESHPAISEVNPLEDFPDDRPFDRFVRELVGRYAGRAGTVRLKLLGDTFDPHAVLWAGGFGGPPHEAVAVVKMRRIMSGHPTVMDALSWFLERENCLLDIFIGNHDLFLTWPNVRRRLVRRLAGRNVRKAGRIRFIGPESDFRETFEGILYEHGMDAEPQNRIKARAAILRYRLGRRLRNPILNEPFGSHLTTGLVYPIKLYHSWIGRLANYRGVFRNSVIHSWGWSFYVFWTTVWAYLYHAFFSFWHIRRQTHLRDMIRVIGQAITNQGVDGYARRCLEKPGIRAVVLGHSHEWRQESNRNGIYVNTGTWGLMFRLKKVSLPLVWKRFRWLEWVWRKIGHFLADGGNRLSVRQVLKFWVWASAVTLLVLFLGGFLGGGRFFPDRFRWLPVALLAMTVLSGVLRVFSSRPKVISEQRFTFALAEFPAGGNFVLKLLEFNPENRKFRPCVR
ncbi:hypothetical protein JW899_02170 [Candidatus Uhrbacteria bacterium]|nr:hypothetical protein [Candidatus Uhrbacteria bacterium]